MREHAVYVDHVIPEDKHHHTGNLMQYYNLDNKNKMFKLMAWQVGLFQAVTANMKWVGCLNGIGAKNANLNEKIVDGPPSGTSKYKERVLEIYSDRKVLKKSPYL